MEKVITIHHRSDRLQFSIPNGWPPPHDRQYYDIGGRELLAQVEQMLSWDGPDRERRALQIIGQGVSIVTQDQFSDAQVKALLDEYVAWAKVKEEKRCPT